MVLRVFLGRTISAAGGPGWAAPPATKAVSGQQQRGNRGDCRAKVNCKQGERLCAVLVGFQGQTLSERSREGRALERSSCALTCEPQQDETRITCCWKGTLPSRAGCTALLSNGFGERTVSAARGFSWMAPPAAYAVSGQCESSVCEECCAGRLQEGWAFARRPGSTPGADAGRSREGSAHERSSCAVS